MTELTLVNVSLTLGLIGITGAFSFGIKKIAGIALWGFASTLMVVSLNFGYNIAVILGLASLVFLTNVILVVFDA